MSERLSYSQLIDLLQQLVADEKSGTLYVTTDSHHAAVVALRDGQIVSLFHTPKRGRAAIPLIRQATGGTYRLGTAFAGVSDKDLLPTPEILAALKADGEPPEAQAKQPTVRDTQPGDHSSVNAEAFLNGLQDLLQAHLGPIATMLVENALEEVGELNCAERLNELIDYLFREIEDASEASTFKDSARILAQSALSG